MQLRGSILDQDNWVICGKNQVTGDDFLEFIMILLVFSVCMVIGSVLNILLKTIKKTDWLITFLISLCVSLFVQILNIV